MGVNSDKNESFDELNKSKGDVSQGASDLASLGENAKDISNHLQGKEGSSPLDKLSEVIRGKNEKGKISGSNEKNPQIKGMSGGRTNVGKTAGSSTGAGTSTTAGVSVGTTTGTSTTAGTSAGITASTTAGTSAGTTASTTASTTAGASAAGAASSNPYGAIAVAAIILVFILIILLYVASFTPSILLRAIGSDRIEEYFKSGEAIKDLEEGAQEELADYDIVGLLKKEVKIKDLFSTAKGNSIILAKRAIVNIYNGSTLIYEVSEVMFFEDSWYFDRNSDGKIIVVKNPSEGLTEEEIQRIGEIEDYDEMLLYMCEIADRYMNAEYDSTVSTINGIANSKNTDFSGDYVYIADLTMKSVAEQGNPFANVNYSALIAAYAVTDDYQQGQFIRYKNKLKEADFLTYSLHDATTIMTLPEYVYAYEEVEATIDMKDYIDSLKDGSEEVKELVIKSIEKDLDDWDKERNKKQLEKVKIQSAGAQKDTATKLNKLDKEIKEIESKITTAKGKIKNIKAGKVTAVKKDIKNVDDSITLTLYQEKKGEDGKQEVLHTVTSLAGEYYEHYAPIKYGNEVYYYMDSDHYRYAAHSKQVHYDKVSFTPFNSTDVFEMFSVDKDATYETSKSKYHSSTLTNLEAYLEFYKLISSRLDSTYGTTISTSQTFGEVMTEDEIQYYLDNLPKEVSGNRRQILKTALSLCGRVSYDWGGKYDVIGWNTKWGEPKSSVKYPYIGLDCSGYVQWVYCNALQVDGVSVDNWHRNLGSTAAITGTCTEISASQLKVGDLGVIRKGGSSDGNANHVGIYIGTDEYGNRLWVHCSSSGTVKVSTFDRFKVFYRVPSEYMEQSNCLTNDIIPDFIKVNIPTDDEFMIIAQTLQGESGKDAGFRACAEACMNGAIASNRSLYEQICAKNYLESYTWQYVEPEKHQDWIRNIGTPSSTKLQILKEVMEGKYVYFEPPPTGKYPNYVMYFRPSWYPKLSDPYVKALEIDGIVFYYTR